MSKVRLILAGALLFAASVTVAAQEHAHGAMQQKSLYERLGGETAISDVVDDFAGRVLADERINKKFARSNAPRLLFFLKQQVCAATGGPCEYQGLDMKASHRNMGVTTGEFNALVGHLVATLDKFNVPEAEKNELLGALAPLKGDIVEVDSMDTGTPLPADFKPAPALPEEKIQQGPFNNKQGGAGGTKSMKGEKKKKM